MSGLAFQKNYDALVIGAGHNGLVAAAYLARAGLQVLVLERREFLGGAAATEPVFPGFKVNTGASDAGLFLPRIADELRLERFGLRFIHSPAVVFAPQPGSPGLTLWRDLAKTQAEISRFSKADAGRYSDFIRWVSRLGQVLGPILTLTPPSLPDYHYSELLPWLRVALQARGLGRQEMMDLLRVLPMPASDFLDEWFESPALKGALGSSAVTGSFQGPKSPGTAFMLLYQAQGAGEAGFRASRYVAGGTGALSDALAQAARQSGAEICPGVSVSQILLDGDRASGVELEDGRQISAKIVVSNADPRRTFFDLVGAPNLEVRFVREVKAIKFRASLARINLALDGLPQFDHGLGSSNQDHLTGRILVCPDLDFLEKAYDDAKYGGWSREPALEIAIPTLSDPSLAPPGKHLASIDVRYAPLHLKNGNWDDERDRFGEHVLQILERHAPGIRALVTGCQVLTPLDLERRFGLPDGDIYHGQMDLHQLLFMRPVAGFGRFRTPVHGLYLCGAGAHPGGGVTGAPGYNAAREILMDWKRRGKEVA